MNDYYPPENDDAKITKIMDELDETIQVAKVCKHALCDLLNDVQMSVGHVLYFNVIKKLEKLKEDIRKL